MNNCRKQVTITASAIHGSTGCRVRGRMLSRYDGVFVAGDPIMDPQLADFASAADDSSRHINLQ